MHWKLDFASFMMLWGGISVTHLQLAENNCIKQHRCIYMNSQNKKKKEQNNRVGKGDSLLYILSQNKKDEFK